MSVGSDINQALREAVKHQMTPAELQEQRVSFVYGNLPEENPLTKDQVRSIALGDGGSAL